MGRLSSLAFLALLGVSLAPAVAGASPVVATVRRTLKGISGDSRFGASVAIAGDLAAVGVPDDDDSGLDAGAVTLFRFENGAWVAGPKLVRAGGAGNERCGTAVALSGDSLLVGCPGARKVIVWDVSKAMPEETAFLQQGDMAVSDSEFGSQIASDGSHAVVLSYGAGFTGGATVFQKLGPTLWSEMQTIPLSSFSGDVGSVALQGNLLVVGIPYGGKEAGDVVILERKGGLFQASPPLLGSTLFGTHVATDGTTVFISDQGGSPQTVRWASKQADGSWKLVDSVPAALQSGSTSFGSALAVDGQRLAVLGRDSGGQDRVFTFDTALPVKQLSQTDLPSSPAGTPPGSLALSGPHLAVGQTQFAQFGGGAPGLVLFVEEKSPGWTFLSKHQSVAGSRGDSFGLSLAWLGNTMIVGAPSDTVTTDGQGTASIFERVNGVWEPAASVTDQGGGGTSGDSNTHLGASVALTVDWAFAGMPEDQSDFLTGKVAAFQRTQSSWSFYGYLPPSPFSSGKVEIRRLGASMAAVGSTIVVGAPGSKVDGAESSGVVNVYQLPLTGGFDQPVMLVPDCMKGQCGLSFGSSVALGTDLLLATLKHHNGSAGAVLVYRRVPPNGLWEFEQMLEEQLEAPLKALQDRYFGGGLVIDETSGFAFINANTDGAIDLVGPSYVYVYDLKTMTQVQRIEHPLGPSRFFGAHLAARNGTLAIDSTYENSQAGTVFFYKLDGGKWMNVGQYDEPGGYPTQAGSSVAVDGDLFAIGAPADSALAGKVLTGDLLLADGASCEDAAACHSGFCIDGVCCNTECSGACLACSTKAGAPSDGVCGAVSAGMNDAMCIPGSDECGKTGACDGKGGCAFVAAGAECGGKCTNTSSSFEFILLTCDGQGSCGESQPIDCGAYGCTTQSDPKGCLVSCTSSSDCVAPASCQQGKCVGQNPQGAACTSDAMCSSGFCANGVCCNEACDGGCMACSKQAGAAKDGTCSSTCPEGMCVNKVCSQAGGAGGGSNGLPDLWNGGSVEVEGGAAGLGGTAGTAGADTSGSGGYQRPRVEELTPVQAEVSSTCAYRAAGGEEKAGASLVWLTAVALLINRRNRRS